MNKTCLRGLAPSWSLYLAIAATVTLTAPAALAAAAPTEGTTVYRCGQTYQQAPCKDGQALAVDDARDPAQRQSAQQAAAAERRAADGLAAERAKREQGLQPANSATGAKRRTHAATTPTSSAQKHPRSQKGKHERPLEVTDKTLYSTRDNRKSTSEPKLPLPQSPDARQAAPRGSEFRVP